MKRICRLAILFFSMLLAIAALVCSITGSPDHFAASRGAWSGLKHDDEGGSFDWINERYLGINHGLLKYYSDNGNLPDGVSPGYDHPSGVVWGTTRENPFDFSFSAVSSHSRHLLGTAYYEGSHSDSTSINWILWSIPLWEIAMLTAMPAIFVVCAAVVSRRHVAKGVCMHCGYDLRATPDCCPECGCAARN